MLSGAVLRALIILFQAIPAIPVINFIIGVTILGVRTFCFATVPFVFSPIPWIPCCLFLRPGMVEPGHLPD